MRINIEIDDALMQKALKLTGLKTKKAVVEKALRLLVQIHQQAAIREWRGKLKCEGNLEQMRLD
jgi:Arc/MetJ family transcription regulator